MLAEVLPKLNKNTPKSHKIQKPIYSNIDNDNIYSYINSYNAFLEFEKLGSNSRTYTPYEITVYVADDLENDIHRRFEKGITHVRLQLEKSLDGIFVPKDISITKIAKTMCKYSSEYIVGEYKEEPLPIIHAIRQSPRPEQSNSYKSNATERDMTLKCGLCGLNGHNESSENGCINFAKWALLHQAYTRLNDSEIITNIRKYLKLIKKK